MARGCPRLALGSRNRLEPREAAGARSAAPGMSIGRGCEPAASLPFSARGGLEKKAKAAPPVRPESPDCEFGVRLCQMRFRCFLKKKKKRNYELSLGIGGERCHRLGWEEQSRIGLRGLEKTPNSNPLGPVSLRARKNTFLFFFFAFFPFFQFFFFLPANNQRAKKSLRGIFWNY